MPTAKPTASSLVRQQVRGLLDRSAAFHALAPDARRAIARDMLAVARALVDPGGLLSQEFRRPLLAGVVTRPATSGAEPGGIRMTGAAMDGLVAAVDFPAFVANLIDSVFGAIVNASIQQMQAYGDLLAAVSKSLDQFVDDSSDQSARDSLAKEFPDLFCWAGSSTPRLRLHAPAGAPGLPGLAATLGLREPMSDPAKPGELKRVVAAARRRVARNRQQVLATMVLMGINRIVVTDGTIPAKAPRGAGKRQ